MRNVLKIAVFALLAIIILVMVVATLVEKSAGSAMFIYGSWWFASLWGVLAVVSLMHIGFQKLQKRPFVFMLHLSFAVILMGALITHVWGKQGILHLRLDEKTHLFALENGYGSKFPFEVCLKEFSVVNYPGTETAMDFVSVVEVKEKETPTVVLTISMNKIGQYGGYRFYQSSYDWDQQGSVFSVAYDPWGIGVTYVGYALLFLSMVLLLVLPDEGFRQALKRLSVVALLALMGMDSYAAPVQPKVLPDSIAQQFGNLYAYYNGRICPLQTVAYDYTTKLYGKSSYQGFSAEQVFTGWLFFPSSWVDQPRKATKGPRYQEEQDAIVQMMLSGEFMHIYPYRDSLQNITWYCQGDNLPMTMEENTWFFVKKSMDYVGELVVMQRYDSLGYTLRKIRKFQQNQAGEVLPSDLHFKAELTYNSMNLVRPLAMFFATLGILLFVFYVRFWLKNRNNPLWLTIPVNVLLALVIVYQTVFLALRWYVSGHLPLSNGYETMQFLAWVVMILTLIIQRRFVLMIPFGFLLIGLTLLVSMMGQSNPQITPLMPVLSSPLLSIHVCIIMLAYALLAFIFFNGLTSLFLKDESKISALYDVSRVMLYPALFCLTAGIFIGAIWANVSWGRYWGWDPKEVWALITMLVYSFAFHAQSLPLFRKPKFFHLYMVLAFLSVLMTYFGVNFLLGGMHSYAS